MSNRFPNNEDKEHVDVIEEMGALCDHCTFQTKCHKYMGMMTKLQELEMEMFEKFTIKLDTIALLTYCPTFVLDPMDNTEPLEKEEYE